MQMQVMVMSNSSRVDWERVRRALMAAKRGQMSRADRALLAKAMTDDVHRYRHLRASVRDGRVPEDW